VYLSDGTYVTATGASTTGTATMRYSSVNSGSIVWF
jgi:hypothetical protein